MRELNRQGGKRGNGRNRNQKQQRGVCQRQQEGNQQGRGGIGKCLREDGSPRRRGNRQ